MKTPILALLACLLGAGFYGLVVNGQPKKTFTFVGHDFEPFYFKSGSQGAQGALYDLLQEVCKLQKKHCKFKIAAYRNAQDLVAEGKADAGGPMGFTSQRTLVYNFSAPLFKTQYCFFTLPKNYKENFTLADIKDHTVGVFGPSATELSLQKVKEVLNQRLKISIEPDNHTAFRKTENNSYDFSYANCQNGQAWIEKTRSSLKELHGLGEKTDYYLIFSKKTFNDQDVKAFNQTLMDLRKSGFLQELADKYKLTLAEIGK